MSTPTFLPYYVLGGSIVMMFALLAVIRSAVAASGWPQAVQRKAVIWSVLIFAGWLAVAAVLAMAGAYRAESGRMPTVEFGLLTPIIVGVLAMWLSPTVRRLVTAASPAWVVGIQLYRVLGVIFLILYGAGQLPGQFGLPAGAGDVIAGLAAPFVALAYARRPQRNRQLVLWWNIFGLADLVIAVTTGLLTSPSPLQLLAFDRPNVLISLFPLVLVPTYLVPISILLHFASLAKLGHVRATGGVEGHVRT